ncbi:MAG: indolepyruvate ferredoxin oxidoreductase family protein [Gammaproteobacteria bacterium]
MPTATAQPSAVSAATPPAPTLAGTDSDRDDKYSATSGRIYLSGIDALVRLPLLQRLRDQAAGLNTAGFISGYRGSPLGGFDEALWKAGRHLKGNHIRFVPGVNEDLAATAVWGTQQVDQIGPARYDGVFAMWYGKGPGVDRCGDVFRHLNHSGSARHGGVLLVAGDDHGAYSSTLPHQSDPMFAASMIPVLYPCNVQEYLDLGLHGWAMSRFSGCAVGFKALADTVESSASVDANPWRVQIRVPHDYPIPEGGLNSRLSPDTVGVQARKLEALMQDHKLGAVLAYARANQINRVTIDGPHARLGIAASGKSYLDVREALEALGIDDATASAIGIRLFKVAMPWPLEPVGARAFADGLDEILVVEEKRQLVESQLKELLYDLPDGRRPAVIGKSAGAICLLPARVDFSVAQIARVIAARVGRFHASDAMSARLAMLDALEGAHSAAAGARATPPRPAYFCSGCPHNRSTVLPEGSIGAGGIGCHAMAAAIYSDHNKTMTHMGGEGATWIGQAPFSELPHVFANLGDGTYFHSGYLAIRAAVAAKVNITYKILYNDAVAMTGGQPVDGVTSVPMIARQMAAEGVRRIALVTEDLGRYQGGQEGAGLPDCVTLHERSELDAVQRSLREVEGASVLIYDQTCAAEKRRRRKKGEYPDPPKRLFINEAVCEGCGDCGVQSNCTSIMPVETEYGRKRAIDQSSCNKDYSCAQGFCPSFVTVKGGSLKKPRSASPASDSFGALPDPVLPGCDKPYNILLNGIGGTGVITIGALLGMAAHLEGKAVSVLDMTGMSQKNGSVTSHIRIGAEGVRLHAQRIASGEADLVIGCDMLTAGANDAVSKMRAGRTRVLINTHQTPTGHFAQQADWQFPAAQTRALIEQGSGGHGDFFDATALATALMGDSIATNIFMLGFAWQKGALPVSEAALLRAIELNGVAVAANKASFLWGRRAGHDLARVQRMAVPPKPVQLHRPPSLDALVARRAATLTAYQNAAYAAEYLELVNQVREAESRLGPGRQLTTAVARNYFRLMAYKDEYEVARLYTDGNFMKQVRARFDGDFSLALNLAPPLFARKDEQGRPLKSEYGPWLWPLLKVLARLKGLRGGWFDPFGYSAERKLERQLIGEYRNQVRTLLGGLHVGNLATAVALAGWPETIRGFGHVKEKAIAAARQQQARLMEQFASSKAPAAPAVADNAAGLAPARMPAALGG